MIALVSTICVFTSGVLADAPPSPKSYLMRVTAAVKQAGEDSKAMQSSAHEAAVRLVAGGNLWAAGYPPFVSELCGRAGGLMLTKPLGANVPADGDVVMYGLAGEPPIPEAVAQSGAHIVAFGDGPAAGASALFSGHAAEHDISPTLASIIPAWVYTGVLIMSCADEGKMPVTYETIGLPSGFPRIQQYQAKGVFWIDHEAHGWATAQPWLLGDRYAKRLVQTLERVDKEERAKLDRTGEWAARAMHDGKTVYMYCMGHFIPEDVANSAIGKAFKTDTWNSGFASFQPPTDKYTKGDLIIHIGYQHPPNGLYERARPAGADIVYVDLLEHRDWKTDSHVIWIDPMWPWDDALVPLNGYDILMLPPSGIVNSAIAWEIYRLATK